MNQKLLKHLLNYDSKTGIFTWKNPIGDRVKKGYVAGQFNKKGYCLIRYNYKLYLAHRLAWLYVYGKNPKNIIDHINGKTSDNRISNLRDVTLKINAQNTLKPHKNNKNGCMGVTWDYNKWGVRIRTDKGRIQIGRYDNLEDAKDAYLLAKQKYHSLALLS